MAKKILITGGPTNEYIDEVMKITNMSSGKIAVQLAEHFLGDWWDVTLLITKSVKITLASPKLKIIRFETTEELMSAIEAEANKNNYDVVIHSSAVADYKPEYSFRMEDMAQEIADKLNQHQHANSLSTDTIASMVFDILKNPDCKVNDSTKISSCEPNLTVKLGLTPKIIESLRKWFPDAYICGFKLLENVSEEELIAAAMKQIKKCKTNLVFANDLAELRKGNASRLVVAPSGYHNIKVDGAEGIFNLIKIAIE